MNLNEKLRKSLVMRQNSLKRAWLNVNITTKAPKFTDVIRGM
jgi:hypothetical protein